MDDLGPLGVSDRLGFRVEDSRDEGQGGGCRVFRGFGLRVELLLTHLVSTRHPSWPNLSPLRH